MQLDWRDEMVLDNGGLDTDHRLQHELIRQFVDLPGEEAKRDHALALLEELRNVSSRHFLREERIQASIRYPQIEEHRAQHRRLAGLLDEIIDQVEARESVFTYAYTKSKADELLQFWFFDHFAKADMRLKPHLAKFAVR
ncbi:bacteriohemerythrin [Azospirillum rugosum]|uniref:Hemerythrin-like metal-binding protein n=1 Tax=Azospirillum rugosum TaxID=416170 RepID=A0ABS4SU36_9PROT|nr:hemerythrin family protein [Azospirillum rugosum]MBP2294895.1 hemerythrin-like metal-binding protein [Azospirillum rugosum]MDQ0528183.1 hemerythrin-like metal-binding protein [Azospirillum rugosum]